MNQTLSQVTFWMGHGNMAGFVPMNKDAVGTLGCPERPTI